PAGWDRACDRDTRGGDRRAFYGEPALWSAAMGSGGAGDDSGGAFGGGIRGGGGSGAARGQRGTHAGAACRVRGLPARGTGQAEPAPMLIQSHLGKPRPRSAGIIIFNLLPQA